MKFIRQEFKRNNISLTDLTPGEQDLLYDALCSYCSNVSPGSNSRSGALARLKVLLESVLPSGVSRNYNAEISTAFLV